MNIDKAAVQLFQKALNGSGEELLTIIPQAAADVLQAAFRNPNLAEKHLLVVLKRRDLDEESIRRICRLSLTESSHNLKVAIAHHPNTPAPQLLAILPQLYLFELLHLCAHADISADQKLAAERTLIQRLPETPLGNKLTLARRATAAVLEALLKGGDSRLLEICLSNPRLKEGAVFQFVRSGIATAETISIVARHPRWQNRPNLREAILTNPKTPPIWFILWLPGMKTSEVRRLVASNRLTHAQRKAVEERLKK
jgi:hypothetical protein